MQDDKTYIEIKDRLIDVEWNMNSSNTYLTDIVLLVNNQNFLMDLITESTKEKIQIVEMHNKDSIDGNICNLTIKVKDREELEKFKNSLNKYKNIKIME